jgi:hypothetical protein
MRQTLATLGAAGVARNLVFPAKVAQNPWRAAALEWFRRRNAVLDAAFYDVGAITEIEAADLAPWLAQQGAIVVTPPSGGAGLRVYETLDHFLDSPDRDQVRTLAVAGVGSSALGGAALARNVADALDETVAAIVSGYGFADVVTEALGGWFCFGALNSVRHAFEGLDRWSHAFDASEPLLEAADGVALARLSPDTATLTGLLQTKGFEPRLLVGHSKGNLIISEALYWLRERDPARAEALGESCGAVLFCAKIGLPPIIGRVIDVTGEYDAFGALNSRPDIPADYVVPHATHSTNPEIPFGLGLEVAAAMRAVAPMLAAPPANAQAPAPSPMGDLPQIAVSRLAG